MDYYLNPLSLSSAFAVPAGIVDGNYKFVKPEHLKILLYVLRNNTDNLTEQSVADACGASAFEVHEALLFWADAGILVPKNSAPIKKADVSEKVISENRKPDRNDCIKRGTEDEKIRYLLREAQMKFGRNLKSNEMSTLVWLYDDEGLDVSLILLIIQYAMSHGKGNIRFIEKIAVSWIEKGINDICEADEMLRKLALSEQAWGIVCRAFGLEKRKPGEKEEKLADKWVNEWNISEKMLECAYSVCVDTKSKFSMPYVAKIIEKWHDKGYKSPEDINSGESVENVKSKKDYASYDIDLYEEMLNAKD